MDEITETMDQQTEELERTLAWKDEPCTCNPTRDIGCHACHAAGDWQEITEGDETE